MLSNQFADPYLSLAVLLSVALIAGGIVAFIGALIEARLTQIYDAAEWKQDAHTAERRAKLQVMQRRERREQEIA